MSKLLAESRTRSEQKQLRDHNECVKLTQTMKEIVDNQRDVHSYIGGYGSSYQLSCDAFQDYKNLVNSVSNYTRIHIDVKNPGSINHITTNVDLDQNMVTYQLSYIW